MIKKVNFDDVDGQELARAEELVEQLERDIIKVFAITLLSFNRSNQAFAL